MFNRRLSKSELDIWIDLLEQQTEFGHINKDLAMKFLTHDDTICFISSVQNEPIGGTVIHRDRTRLGMILASVAVKDEYREQGAYSVIKSSLPFFKTVALRDVEALIPDEPSDRKIGFPGSLELDYWTKEVLERIGFEIKGTLYSYTMRIEDVKNTRLTDNQWDTQPELDKAKNLIWDTSKILGLTNSHIWTAFDFAMSQGLLRTITEENSTKLVTSIIELGASAIISLVVSEEMFTEPASELIAELIRESSATSIFFPLVGKGQTNLIETISDKLGGSLKRRSMTLLRKPL
jgi:hypothetical protein